jgi:hypothetical protein
LDWILLRKTMGSKCIVKSGFRCSNDQSVTEQNSSQ